MPKDLEGITRINACLLAPDVHPLIDASFLDLLNVATKKHQREISYYAATLKEAKKAATVTAEVDC